MRRPNGERRPAGTRAATKSLIKTESSVASSGDDLALVDLGGER